MIPDGRHRMAGRRRVVSDHLRSLLGEEHLEAVGNHAPP